MVRTTWVKDTEPEDAGWYGQRIAHKAGDVIVEVFGPYVTASQSRNYSQLKPKSTVVQYTTQVVEHQKLSPVLALQPSGSLVMELDWVGYDV